MTRIILVRHGQSQHHMLRLSGGWTDTPLTELGHQQAHLAANRLREELMERLDQITIEDLVREARERGVQSEAAERLEFHI